ncbi:hypothetical protein BJ508DRAFT_329301 [Ascobolus immersus RN42]|uniref:F-box domain-containing protein n=1 Tax=Ascobolus immersus RN42 TaxID=1160509 RepID=A0A3N4I2B0_ASCIM|nr:hypothetical protein BJ508DRAFT_329301 [Ascobolus immersus RN42]
MAESSAQSAKEPVVIKSPNKRASLFHLPIELRLEIYRHCSAFTLLQVLHTCHRFFDELNYHSHLFRNAAGFYAHPRHVEPGNYRVSSHLSPASSWNSNFPAFATTSLPETTRKVFGIWCIRKLSDKEERDCFVRHYSHSADRKLLDYNLIGYCPDCWMVLWRDKRFTGSKVRRKCQVRGRWGWQYEYVWGENCCGKCGSILRGD